jgi:hypothetical protein
MTAEPGSQGLILGQPVPERHEPQRARRWVASNLLNPQRLSVEALQRSVRRPREALSFAGGRRGTETMRKKWDVLRELVGNVVSHLSAVSNNFVDS